MMLRNFAWSTFEMTGNIDSYMFYREIRERNPGLQEKRMAEEEAAPSK